MSSAVADLDLVRPMATAPGIIILLLISLSVVAGIVWLVWRFIGHIGRFIAPPIVVAFVYIGYRAFYTTDGDLMREFSSKSGLSLPTSAKLVHREVDGYPFWSDYECEALIEVIVKDFAIVSVQLKARKKDNSATNYVVSDRLRRVPGREFEVADWVCIPNSDGDRLCWGILKDGKTIFFSFMVT